VLLDVANSDATGEGVMNMSGFWIGLMIIQVSMIWFIFPFCIVYYESDEGFEFVNITISITIDER
jgi:hypothetical protein